MACYECKFYYSQGYGACPFLQWYHDVAQTTNTVDYGLNQDGVFNSESPKRMELDSPPGMDNLEGPQTLLSLPSKTLDNSDLNVIAIQRKEDEEGISSMASVDDPPILLLEEFWNAMMEKELHVSCLKQNSRRLISAVAVVSSTAGNFFLSLFKLFLAINITLSLTVIFFWLISF